jgi:hypothetical protein
LKLFFENYFEKLILSYRILYIILPSNKVLDNFSKVNKKEAPKGGFRREDFVPQSSSDLVPHTI